jgi:hypothetical protein
MSDFTVPLEPVQSGHPEAPGQLLPLVDDDLRRPATNRLAHEAPRQTLQPTPLVLEAYRRDGCRGQLTEPRALTYWADREVSA